MTQFQDPPILQNLARRRALPAAPVLIRIPAVAAGPVAPRRRARRRRLRREVRVVGYFLLATLPLWLAIASLGGERRPALMTASAPAIGPDPAAFESTVPAISISLEPALAARPSDFAAPPVFLSSQLLPADVAPEETSHGGH